MKKVIVATLLIAALAATAGFAQELKFDGYINSGLGLIVNDAGEADVPESDHLIKAFGVDSEQNAYRFQLNASYTTEAQNAGAKFRFQAQAKPGADAGSFTLPYLYGWVKFLNTFTLSGGIVDDVTWKTGDWWINDDSGEGLGLLLKATPLEGLDLGFGAYVASPLDGANNNALSNLSATATANALNLAFPVTKAWDAKYTLSGAYTLQDVFRVGVTFRTKNRAGRNAANRGPTYPYYEWSGRQESQQLITEFRFLGAKDLTAVVAMQMDNLQNFKNQNETQISEAFGYKIDSFAFGLNAVQGFWFGGDPNGKINYDQSWLFNLWGSYDFDSIVPRLDLVYITEGSSNFTGNDPAKYTYHRRAYTFVKNSRLSDDKDDYSVFNVRPSVKFNIDSKTFIEVGDAVYVDYSTNDNAFGRNRHSLVTNVFYIDIKFSF